MESKIIVDSCCDMTPELINRLGVVSVPLTMRLGEKEYIDDASLDINKFIADMKACKEKVGSAAPAPYLFQQAIENEKQSFIITLSKQLSASYNNAVIGENTADGDNIDTFVFDSKSASAGEVLIAIKIRELIQKGMQKENIIKTVSHFIDNMKTYFVLENHDNLLKNGRLSKVKERILGLLSIKLIMGSNDGNIALYAKARGIKQIIDKLLYFIAQSGRKTDEENFVISHCNNLDFACQIRDAVVSRFNFKEIFIVPTGGLSSLYADDKGVVLAF